MKLFIQIPCYNEEESLPLVLNDLPKSVQGFDETRVLVVNDGSTDGTVRIAQEHEVNHIVNFRKNFGLAIAFKSGIEECLRLGADVIVNIDADHQYKSEDIPGLVKPITDGVADLVIGTRPINEIEEFSSLKKLLQKFGSWIVRIVSSTNVVDATSGFRAMNRDAALRINVFSSFTYTLETVIQAGQARLRVCSVPVGVNKQLRPSRLAKSTISYLWQSLKTIVRISILYRPFRFFFAIGSCMILVGTIIGIRFLFYYYQNDPGHIQSLILVSILIGIGFQTILVGVLADMIAVNRRLLEDIQFKQRKSDIESEKTKR